MTNDPIYDDISASQASLGTPMIRKAYRCYIQIPSVADMVTDQSFVYAPVNGLLSFPAAKPELWIDIAVCVGETVKEFSFTNFLQRLGFFDHEIPDCPYCKRETGIQRLSDLQIKCCECGNTYIDVSEKCLCGYCKSYFLRGKETAEREVVLVQEVPEG